MVWSCKQNASGKASEQALLAKVTRWAHYIKDLGWNRLGLQPSEMLEVVADRDVRRINLELLPPQPSRT